MKILFDQCVPNPLRSYLSGHAIFTAKYLGWSDVENGALLALAESAGFECLLTADQSLCYQQNLKTRRISVFMLTDNDWKKIKPRVFDIAAALATLQPGSYTEFIV